ncbi:MAG: ABC transporter ATP-binding protein [Thermoprotei archaeon]|nr:ABC transporter ATP-binding protein [Thermoprotei archaeon]
MKGIVKVYPDGTQALKGVDFEASEGEIHALLGENGAGKTTLMRILYGEIRPTKGEIYVFGEKADFKSPREALRSGIAMVYQQFSLIPSLTVAENIYLALSSVRRISPAEVRARAEELSRKLGWSMPFDYPIESLPVGLRQRVEVLKALLAGSKVLILDEPTSVLTPLEVEELFKVLKSLRDEGMTIILITHKIREAKRVSDRVTILRRGLKVGTFKTAEISEPSLARLMIGEEIELTVKGGIPKPGAQALVVEKLKVKDDMGVLRVKEATLTVKYGEIVGIAGVQGNGQRELVEAIAGLRPAIAGRILIDGVDATRLTASKRGKLGLSYIPESKLVGLALEMNIVENSIMTLLSRFTRRLVDVDWGKARDNAGDIVRDFGVVCRSLDDTVKSLSGGNQQKLMVGREIRRRPKILVAHEPTQGLDVATANMVRRRMLNLRDEGSAILLVSSDLEELLSLSDRLLVIYDGRIVSEGRPEDYTLEKLGLLMGGVIDASYG